MFIVGTGIDPSHQEFVDSQVLELQRDGTLVPARNIIPEELHRDIDHGENLHHEAFVASLIAGKTIGVAPGHPLISVWVERDVDGYYCEDSLEEALKSINTYLESKIAHGANSQAIINFSYGGDPTANELELIDRFQHYPLLMIGSAGNEAEPTRSTLPGRHGSILVVGSTDSDKREAAYSNYGHRIDVYSPGEELCGAYSRSGTYCVSSGTSYAAPIVAGLAFRTIKEINATLGVGKDPGIRQQFVAMAMARARLLTDAQPACVALQGPGDLDQYLDFWGRRHAERAAPMARLTSDALKRQIMLNEEAVKNSEVRNERKDEERNDAEANEIEGNDTGASEQLGDAEASS